MESVTLSLPEAYDLALEVLSANGFSADHAAAISAASRGSDGTVHERRRIVREDAAFPGEVEKYLHKYALPGAKG